MAASAPGGEFTYPNLLSSLLRKENLSAEQSSWMMDLILNGDATPVQIAGFAIALRAKGETVEELSGIADAMLAHATPVTVPGRTVDIVGSGGDRLGSVNISTMAGIVAAAAGARVAKHGNRAASSSCGTADVLEALGVALEPDPTRQASIVDASGICFMFAALYHRSLRHAGVARKELGVATSFNLLGPLTNPARPAAQAVGIADRRMAPLVAGVLAGRGVEAMVFHGGDGLDELTTTTTSQLWMTRDGQVLEGSLDPTKLGIPAANFDELVGGDAAHNAQVVRDLLAGKTGAVRDIVILNAAAALLVYKGINLDVDIHEQMAEHLVAAAAAIDSGAGERVLAAWVEASNA